MSFHWGSKKFKYVHELREWLKANVNGKVEIEDHAGVVRTITDKKTGLLVDTQKLHKVVSANGRVWYSSWYKPEYPYKAKSLKQRLAEVKADNE